MDEYKTLECCMLADEMYQMLDEVIKYNNIKATKEQRSLKPFWFGDINLLQGVIRVDFTGESLLLYGIDNCLKNIIFVGKYHLKLIWICSELWMQKSVL